MSSVYADLILDHAKHPRNHGTLPDVNHRAEANNPLCGDKIHMDVQVSAGKISAIAFSGQGCAISQASASLLTEKAKEMQVVDLKKMGKDDIVALLGIELSPNRLKCALLSLEVLQKALN